MEIVPCFAMESVIAVLCLVLIAPAKGEIIIPMRQWFCNYCAMGPQENPEDCGTPVLCMFYGLLILVILFTIYSTIKGSTE